MTRPRRAVGGAARSPGRARRTRRRHGRRAAASSPVAGRSARVMLVIARIAAGMSGCAPVPTAPRIADPRTAVSSTAGTATGKPVTSALTAFQKALRAGPPQTRISVTWTPAASIGAATWRMASADASTIARATWPRPCPRVRPARTPRASGSQIGDRSPARYGRKTRPSAPGGVAAASARSASVVIVAAEDVVAVPVERPARRRHRGPDAVQAGQRRRRHEPAGDVERPVPVDAETARRAARVVGVARLEQAGAEVAREGVHGPADDGDARVAGRAPRPRRRRDRRRPARSRRAVAAGRPARRRPRRAPDPGRAGPGRAARRRPRSAGTRATPRSRGTSRSRPPTAGSWRSTQSAAGRPAERPAPDAGRRARARRPRPSARVSRKVIAGRVASPRASTAASVGPWPSTPIATTSARSSARSARTALIDRRPPRARVLLGPAVAARDIEAVAAPGERQQPAVEGDQAGLDLGRAEVESEDGRRRGRAASAHRGRRVVERDDGLGGRDVRDQRPDDARPQRAEDRPDLALARRDADADGDAPETTRIEGDDPLAQGRADEPAVEVERRDEDLADRAGRLEVALEARRRAGPRSRPGRRSRTARHRAAPTGRGSRGRPRARRATVAWPRRRPGPAPSAHAPARRARRRCAGTARAPVRSTSSRRTAARP